MWQSRITSGLLNSKSVDLSHVPIWMRAPQKESELQPVPKSNQVSNADTLPPLKIKIFWDKEAEFEDKDELDDALKLAKAKSITIPSTDQILNTDPRLCKSGEFFRDSIRRQFNCQKLQCDIRNLTLLYKDGTKSHEKDGRRDNWKECQSTFADLSKTEFVLHLELSFSRGQR